MPVSAPQIRVGYMRMFLGQIEQLPADQVAALSSALAEIEAKVAAAPVLGWMPGEINFETCETMTRVIGVEATSDFFQQLWPRVWAESPFMSSFIQGVLRMHRDPGAFVKYLRVGYPQVFKHFGHWSVETYERDRAVARLRDAPARCFVDDGVWLRYVADSLITLYEAGGHQGTVDVAEKNAERRDAVLEFRWTV